MVYTLYSFLLRISNSRNVKLIFVDKIILYFIHCCRNREIKIKNFELFGLKSNIQIGLHQKVR